MQNTLKKRGKNAAKRYLELSGFEVEGEHEGYIVAWDLDCLVFVAVETAMKMPDIHECKPRERREFERAVSSYLATFDRCDFAVRLDKCELEVTGESQAFLRHTRNYSS